MKKMPASARGSTLIEVLVTIVVFAIGLVGLAGLHLINIKNAQSAYHRSQATFLTYDILDRMRANRAFGSNYPVAIGSTVPAGGNAIAVADILAWKSELLNTLPDGEGSVAVSGNLVTVRIEWDDRRASTAAGDPCYTSGARKACFVTQAGL